MNDNPRCLYHSTFTEFLCEDENATLGLLCDHYHGDALTSTREAWKGEISIMRELVSRLDHDGRIIFEYDIPRLGKRIDVVLILRGIIFCLEFKVGKSDIMEADVDQVLDYALDLKNFHKFSQEHIIVPVLIATRYQKASSVVQMSVYDDKVVNTAFHECKNLTSIIIPKSVKRIANYAFSECRNLQCIHLLDPFGCFTVRPAVTFIVNCRISSHPSSIYLSN